MYKVRLISQTNDGAGIAFLCNLQGGDVDFFIKDPKAKNAYKNFPIERVSQWQTGINKRNDALLFDMTGMGETADKKRADGYYIYGAGKIQDDIELDRALGLQVCKEAGLNVPQSKEFTDFQKAIEWVELQEDDKAYVYKPSDNMGCAYTYVAADKEDTIRNLEHQSTLQNKETVFVLQEVIEGVEISSEVWFVNGKPLPNTYNNTLETKKFMNDDLSSNTGCMSSIVKFNACPKLYSELFENLFPFCLKNKFHGPLDVNCIISQKDHKPYVLEFTPRLGYSSIYAFLQGLNMKLNEFIYACACGDIQNDELKFSQNWLGALRITVPPYPHSDDASKAGGIPVSGIGRFDWHNIIPIDMMIDDSGQLAVGGYDGVVCEVCDNDEDLSVLCRKLRKRADGLVIKDKQFRTDVLDNATNRLKKLSEYGYYKG